jgi:hypothetical protein
MVIRPATQRLAAQRRGNQVNGLAVFVSVVLLLLSTGGAVAMALSGASLGWVIAEVLVLNLIGL